MPATTVRNLRTGERLTYTLEPREAVMCAYAQGARNDHNTWTHAERYSHIPKQGPMGLWHAEDWTQEPQRQEES